MNLRGVKDPVNESITHCIELSFVVPHHFTGPNHLQATVLRSMADMVSEKALVREREGKSIPSMRELLEQAAVNPEVFEKIGPERTIQMMFFVGDYSKFNVFVQKSE